MEFNFCRRCGEALEERSAHSWTCKNKHTIYLNPAPSSGVFFITKDRKVVISRRATDPAKGSLDSIGGFIDPDESALDAVKREILEETGLGDDSYGDLHLFCTAPTRYQFEGEDKRVITMFYWAMLNEDAQPIASDDVAEIITISPIDIDLSKIYGDDVKIAITELQKLMKDGHV